MLDFLSSHFSLLVLDGCRFSVFKLKVLISSVEWLIKLIRHREITLDYIRPVFEFYEYVLQFARSCITVIDFSPQIIADEEDFVFQV